MKKYVVLTSTSDSVYDFFLPIAERFWVKVGYEPIVFLVGTKREWSLGHRGVAYKELSSIVNFIPRIPGVPDANVAMSIRQHAAALPWISLNDLVLVGDVDLLPLQKDFYHQHDPKKNDITVYFSSTNKGYFPAYGPSMTAGSWYQVMSLQGDHPVVSMLRTFEESNIQKFIDARKSDPTKNELWIFDETDASSRIRKSRLSEGLVEIPVERERRLCRHSWPSDLDAGKYVDFHCPRPGWVDGNLEKILAVISQTFPEILQWFEEYVVAYLSTGPVWDDPLA